MTTRNMTERRDSDGARVGRSSPFAAILLLYLVSGAMHVALSAAITGTNGSDTLNGSIDDDTIVGGPGDDTILGGWGIDTITGGPGRDTMNGGEDGDTYLITGAADGFDIYQDNGTSGTDTIAATANGAVIGLVAPFQPSSGIEAITGQSYSNVVIQARSTGGVMNLSQATLTNIQRINGLIGADVITGSSGADEIHGGDGSDTLNGGPGNDVLNGGRHADTIDGGNGSDIVYVDANGGNDEYKDTGTSGADEIRASADNVVIAIRNGFSATSGFEKISGQTFANVTIEGTIQGDTLNFGSTTLTAISAIRGGKGADTITGSAGNDTIEGGRGDDTIAGGAGNDTFAVGAGSGFDTVSDAAGTDQIVALSDGAVIGFKNRFEPADGIELISASGKTGVTIAGNVQANILNFSATTLQGIAAIDPGNGGDTVTGSAGPDTFIVGKGDDEFTGGAGADEYVVTNGLGNDVVKDFAIGEDKLDVRMPAYKTFQQFMAKAKQVGTNTLFDFGGHSLRLDNVALSSITASNLKFTANATPVFTSGTAESVDENTAAGTQIHDADVYDPDSAAVTFSLGGADAARFSIDATTGAVKLLAAPDYENPADADTDRVYGITISAKDDANNTATIALSIAVSDLNDVAPSFTTPVAATVAENTPPGTVIYDANVTDPDGDPASFVLVASSDANHFNVNPATGELSFVAAPNYEAPADADKNNVYQVALQASDGLNTAQLSLAVTVTDVAEVNTAPVITSLGGRDTAEATVRENTAAVAKITAADAEQSNLAYAIVGGADAAFFSIGAASGDLAFKTAPDFDRPMDADWDDAYDVVVQVSDGALTDTQAISVAVEDVDEPVTIVRANTTATGQETLGGAGRPWLSGDGNLVAYAQSGIMVKNLATGAVDRLAAGNVANISVDGKRVTSDSGAVVDIATKSTVATFSGGLPVLSRTGAKVAYLSSGSLHVKDTSTNAVIVGSSSATNIASSGSSFRSSFSKDDNFIAFESTSATLVTGDTNGVRDVFLKNLATKAIQRLSTPSSGANGNGPSHGPTVSRNGKVVAFSSDATNLVVGDTNGRADVFVKDLLTGSIQRVSTSATDAQGNGDSGKGSGWGEIVWISPDSKWVGFVSSASNLVPGDTNNREDIFVKNIVTGKIKRIVADVELISGGGGRIGFMTPDASLVSGDTNGAPDIFVVTNW